MKWEDSTVNFSDYVKMLYPFLGGGIPQSEYVSLLINHMVQDSLSDAEKSVLDLKPDTYAKWYQGRKGNSIPEKRAAEILTFRDPGKFETFVYDTLSDESATDLEEKLDTLNFKFNSVLTGDLCSDVANKCAEFFIAVLNFEANTHVPVPTEPPSTRSLIRLPDYGNQLFLEEAGKCPNDGCTNLLYKKSIANNFEDYEIAVIDPQLPEGIENSIALCHDCYVTFEQNRNPQSINRMKEIKQGIFRSRETLEIVCDSKLQEGLEKVVRKIAALPANALTELNYKPVTLEAKIPTDVVLLLKVKTLVSACYPFVQDIFKEVSNETGLRYRALCSEIRTAWILLDEEGRDPDEVFAALTDLISNKINEKKKWCEIVVAYFVQECEVFNEITE